MQNLHFRDSFAVPELESIYGTILKAKEEESLVILSFLHSPWLNGCEA